MRALVRDPASSAQEQLSRLGLRARPGRHDRPGEPARRAVEGVDAVVHLVAILAGRSREEFERIMMQGTRDLVEAAKEAGRQRLRAHERARHQGGGARITPYYHAKWEEEQAVKYPGSST